MIIFQQIKILQWKRAVRDVVVAVVVVDFGIQKHQDFLPHLRILKVFDSETNQKRFIV